MDGATLARAMGNSLAVARYHEYAPDFTRALIQANCTTVNRVAMFCAQVGHESAGLRYMEEIASGAAYEGRRDLGNTQRGDGRRFKGRGPIQLTGRHNYGQFGQWAARVGLVNDPTFFQKNPTVVATSRWGFLAAAWYWTVARPRLNSQADAGDLVAATRSINGGTNGLGDRRRRWNSCLRMGTALLAGAHTSLAPTQEAKPPAPELQEEFTMLVVLPASPGKEITVRVGIPPRKGWVVGNGDSAVSFNGGGGRTFIRSVIGVEDWTSNGKDDGKRHQLRGAYDLVGVDTVSTGDYGASTKLEVTYSAEQPMTVLFEPNPK